MRFVPICRPAKHKTAEGLRGALAHHLRELPTANADPERTPSNVRFVGAGRDASTTTAGVLASVEPLVKRRDAVRAVELLLGASNDYWDEGPADWRALGEALGKWLEAEFGASNVHAFGVHLDERRPHFYAVVTPITPDGRLAAAHWFDGPDKLAAMHDRIAAHLAPLGFERAMRGVRQTHLAMGTLHAASAGSDRAQAVVRAELTCRQSRALEAVAEDEAIARHARRRRLHEEAAARAAAERKAAIDRAIASSKAELDRQRAELAAERAALTMQVERERAALAAERKALAQERARSEAERAYITRLVLALDSAGQNQFIAQMQTQPQGTVGASASPAAPPASPSVDPPTPSVPSSARRPRPG